MILDSTRVYSWFYILVKMSDPPDDRWCPLVVLRQNQLNFQLATEYNNGKYQSPKRNSLHKWKMFHCYVQFWRLSVLSRWEYIKNTPASMDSTRFWGLEVEPDRIPIARQSNLWQEHVMICDDWHNMSPRDCFKMEYYEPMIDEEKTSRSTWTCQPHTPNRRTKSLWKLIPESLLEPGWVL